MKALLTCNISEKTARVGETDWQPPVQTFGETLTLALRLQRTAAGEVIEPDYTVTALQCSLGFVDARPLGGTTALQIGSGAQTADNTTTAFPHNVAPKALQDLINAKTAVVTAYGAATVRQRDGSYYIRFASAAAAVPMQLRDNALFPLCLGQVNAVEIDEVWEHELRLIQLPVDSTTTSERILPPAPTIERIQAGGESGDYKWNEIQRLTVRPDFRATYYLSFGFARTTHLAKEDGPEEVLAALTAAIGVDQFTATLVKDYTIDIEFVGDFAGVAQELLTVTAVEPPPGDLTFSLPLNRAALLVWLRAQELVTLPLEVRLEVTEGDEETTLVPIRTLLTIQRPLNLPELEENPNVDWLRPPSPKNYKLFNPDNVITGQQYYPTEVGDGVATSFVITHGLATTVVRAWVTENTAGGMQLVEGVDYEVEITDANSVTVTALDGAPANDAWLVVVMSAQTVAAFADDLEIEIDQVTGLEDRLAAVETRLEDLETLLPSGNLTRPATSPTPDAIEIPNCFIVYPNSRLAAGFEAASADGLTGKALLTFPTIEVRPPGLLPALRDTSVTTMSALPGSPTAGAVYQNTGGAAITIPGGLGRRGRSLPINEYAGYDGRVWYHLTRGTTPGSSTSYFPTDFEQEMVPPITFERDTWRAGQVFSMEFELALQMIRASSNAQWTLVIEWGEVPSETDASVTAIDLITDNGTGTHRLVRNGTIIGTFTSVFGTDVITCAGHGLSNGDIVQLTNTGGALPAPLAASTDYVVRDVTTNTLKLALLTTTLNLRGLEWNTTPLLAQRLTVSALKQTRKFGARIMRSTANVMTAEGLKSGSWEAAASTPPTPRFALRVRLVNFDTENSVTAATGYAFAALTSAQATIGS